MPSGSGLKGDDSEVVTAAEESKYLDNPIVQGILKSMKVSHRAKLSSQIVSPDRFDDLASQQLTPHKEGDHIRRSLFVVKPVSMVVDERNEATRRPMRMPPKSRIQKKIYH